MTQRTHLIVGNGPCGVVAAESLRARRPQDRIVLVGDEDVPPYSRMAIPYRLIGNIEEKGMYLRKSEDHFDKLRIEQVQGRVTALDTQAKRATLSDGVAIAYDTCLLAVGSRPVRPPISGLDSPLVSTCWTMDDLRKIMELAKPGARVLQMGAGFIGCIILEALALRGVKLTVVEMGDRMVPRMMGPVAGNMIRRWCEEKGVRVLTSTKVASLQDGAPLQANFEPLEGEKFSEDFDLVIQATGVRPNVEWLAGSGIEVAGGIVVDEHLRTTAPDVYAAGDCAEAFDPWTGKRTVSAIQPNAVDQARLAATNMAGGNEQVQGVTQINVLETLGLVSTSFGQWQGREGAADRASAEYRDDDNYRYIRLEFEGDKLVGCNTVGYTNHVGVMRGLVEGGVSLGAWKDELMREPARVMEAWLATAGPRPEWQGPARGTTK